LEKRAPGVEGGPTGEKAAECPPSSLDKDEAIEDEEIEEL
jgi:hypothetical protein